MVIWQDEKLLQYRRIYFKSQICDHFRLEVYSGKLTSIILLKEHSNKMIPNDRLLCL